MKNLSQAPEVLHSDTREFDIVKESGFTLIEKFSRDNKFYELVNHETNERKYVSEGESYTYDTHNRIITIINSDYCAYYDLIKKISLGYGVVGGYIAGGEENHNIVLFERGNENYLAYNRETGKSILYKHIRTDNNIMYMRKKFHRKKALFNKRTGQPISK